MKRRSFLAAGASAPAVFSFQPSDKIRLGIIGFGSRGAYLFNEIRRANEPGMEVAAICDVYSKAREQGAAAVKKTYNIDAFLSSRFEEVLHRKDIDAVILSAPDFTHSPMLERAMQAGKDAYCEKPMGTNLADARKAYLAVKREPKRVVQIGTQRRSEPGLIACAREIQAGAIGKITRVDTQVHFQEPRWRRDHHMIQPSEVDWDAFTMGRFQKPFDARLFREWQLFPETTNGIPGLWMSHLVDLASWFLNEPYPKSAVASGGVYLWKDGRDTCDVFHALLEYTDCLYGFGMSLTNSAGSRNEWYGTKGTLDGDRLVIMPRGSRAPDRVTEERKIQPVAGVESHMAKKLRCLRSRQTPRADIQSGFSHAVAGCMAAEALRAGRKVRFNTGTLDFA